MPIDLLSELKKLQHQRSDSSPFASHVEFHTWADKVLPLLSFDQKLYNRFRSIVLATNSARVLDSKQQETENINTAIGILNQAITSLEVNPVQNSTANPAESKPVKPNNKSSISVIKIAEAVIGTVVAACIFFLIANHFGLKLN